MIDRRALLGLVGGAIALGLVWWSPTFGGEGPRSVPTADPTVSVVGVTPVFRSEPATLAAAVIAHLDADEVTGLAGTTKIGPMAEIDLADGSTYVVTVSHHPLRARCLPASVVCRKLEDGTLVTMRLRDRPAKGPSLDGVAYRADGSTLWLDVDAEQPDVDLARAILEDGEVGWSASPETVVAGQDLDLDDIEITETVRAVPPPRRGAGHRSWVR